MTVNDELLMILMLAAVSVRVALHQYMPLWLGDRGLNNNVIVVEGEELVNDASLSVVLSITFPSGPTHSITRLCLRF